MSSLTNIVYKDCPEFVEERSRKIINLLGKELHEMLNDKQFFSEAYLTVLLSLYAYLKANIDKAYANHSPEFKQILQEKINEVAIAVNTKTSLH